MNNLTLMIRHEEKIFGGTEMDDENGDEEEVEDGMREKRAENNLWYLSFVLFRLLCLFRV